MEANRESRESVSRRWTFNLLRHSVRSVLERDACPTSWALRWGFVAALSVVAVGLTMFLVPYAGGVRFFPCMLATVIAGVTCGRGPAVAAAFGTTMAGLFFVIEPVGSFVPRTREDAVYVLGVLMTSLISGHIAGSQRAAKQAARREAQRSKAIAEQAAAVIETMQDGVWVFEPGGQAIMVNDAAVRIAGAPSKQDLLKHLRDYEWRYTLCTTDGHEIKPDEWPIELVRRGQEVLMDEYVVKDVETGRRWNILYSGRVVHDVEGRPLSVMLARDVTLRREQAAELKRQGEQFRRLAEAMPQIVWLSNGVAGGIEYINQQWMDYTGASEVPKGAKEWSNYIHPDDINRIWDTTMASHRAMETWQDEYRVRRSDGEYRWFLGRAVPILDDSGQAVRWLGTATDIHDQKESEFRLAEALSVREEFISIAGHELKTPLSALMLQLHSILRVAEREKVGDALQLRLGKSIATAVRLERLINQLLDVSRIEAGRLHMEIEEMDLVALVRDIVSRFADTAIREGTDIHLDMPEALHGRWDRDRIDQVLTNVIGNAVKYGRGRPVEVKISTKPDEACIEVTDKGIGIEPDQQARIFERFERAVATREYGGFGLGLWISRQIVEASGGCITVRSKKNEGSTFTICLPHRHESDSKDDEVRCPAPPQF